MIKNNEIISPMIEITLESTMTWNNIMVECIKNESVMLLSEDNGVFREKFIANGKKIIKWIKDFFNSIKKALIEIFKKLKRNIITLTSKVSKRLSDKKIHLK